MITKPIQLIYPTIDLFLYDIREGFEYTAEINHNRRQFWQKIDPSIDETKLAELAKLENPEADYVPLLAKPFESPLDGYYYALQFGDIYSLQIACSGEYKDADSQKRNDGNQAIENLGKLKQTIINKLNSGDKNIEITASKRGTIGQTWLVSVQIADSNQDPKQLAKECYEKITLNSNWQPEFKEQGRFLGARLFQYWHSPTNWNQEWEEFSQENYHIVFCLFPAGKDIAEIRQKVEDIYLDLTRLFCYRHKIIWAYWHSRRLKDKLKQQSGEIRGLVDKVRSLSSQVQSQELNLQELQVTLTQSFPTLSDYAVNLNELESLSSTIKLNLDNYKSKLQKIERDTNSYLKLFADFGDFAGEKYLQQVETDCARFLPGLTVLENLIRTIGSVSEIEQTKSNRTLNTTLTATAIGLAFIVLVVGYWLLVVGC
jgi:DNA repair exonuclease SbcCD ATPase subunit